MNVQVTPRMDVIPVSRRGSSTGIHVQVMSNAKSESDAEGSTGTAPGLVRDA
jgi:hypothetical protein